MSKLDDFDPNRKNKPQIPPFATYIPSRRPEFKVHSNQGHAKNAINGVWPVFPAALYQWQDDKWVEVDRVERATHCSRCEKPFDTTYERYGQTIRELEVSPKYKSPRFCRPCVGIYKEEKQMNQWRDYV